MRGFAYRCGVSRHATGGRRQSATICKKEKNLCEKKFPLVCLAALIFAAAGPLVSIAVSAEGTPKPNTAQQETAKSEPAKPQTAKSGDDDNGTMNSGDTNSEDSESDQPGGEGDGSQD
jgi:hypothetical protein